MVGLPTHIPFRERLLTHIQGEVTQTHTNVARNYHHPHINIQHSGRDYLHIHIQGEISPHIHVQGKITDIHAHSGRDYPHTYTFTERLPTYIHIQGEITHIHIHSVRD